jgi:hypothetical protein
MTTIQVNNPYHDEKYQTEQIDLGRWQNFLYNHARGNESCISFYGLDVNAGKYVYITLNPKNFASIRVGFDNE